MLAIIVCGTSKPALHGLDEHQPAALIRIGDRPVSQHALEYLIGCGATEIHFVIDHLPEQIEAYFGDGTRWGRKFAYHLLSGQDKLPRLLKMICAGRDGNVLLAAGECLPAVPWPGAGAPVAMVRQEAGEIQRTDWGLFPASAIEDFATCPNTLALPWLSAETAANILAGQRQLLDGKAATLELSGNKAQEGAWIGRNVRIHPTATLTPPFWIGPNCRIGAGTRIGPYAVVAENCVIDDESTMENSMVTPGTYIGSGLELQQVIVDRNLLVNARLETSYLISEAFLAGSLDGGGKPRGPGAAERLLALLIFLLLSPLWLAGALAKLLAPGRKTVRYKFVALPAARDNREWVEVSAARYEPATSHFWHRFLPGLPAAIAGKIGLTGVEPRDQETLKALPEDWKVACLTAKAGLVTESLLAAGPGATQDETYSAEAFYSAVHSFGYDLSLLRRYAVSLFSAAHRISEGE